MKGGKRLKAVVEERNTLCTNLSAKESENKNLSSQLDSVSRGKAELQKKYDNLTNEKLSQATTYDNALKQKSDELNEREKALKELRQKIARQDSLTRRLNNIIRDAMLGFNPDELSVSVKNGKVYVSLSDKLLFKSGSSAVESKGKDALKVLADVLDKNQDIEILVEGHTDNVPIKTSVFKDNWDLSVARATSITRILTEDYKLSPTRVTAAGRGEFFPKASNDTPEGRAKNRRTEIILSPKLDEIMKLIGQQ